jgi:hypothetical protein
MTYMVEQKFTPPWLPDTWSSAASVTEVLPLIRKMRAEAAAGPGFYGYAEQNAQVAAKL